MDQGQSLLFVATLGNDTRNLGVTWQPLTGSGCAGSSCGTLTNITSTSVTYTAPSGLTTGISVSLEAISKANSGVTSTATITIVLPVTFTTTSLPNGSNGVAYNQTIITSGGVAPITYTVGSRQLACGPETQQRRHDYWHTQRHGNVRYSRLMPPTSGHRL